jgi:glycosyltransferase involved in cell wall biosynthesis
VSDAQLAALYRSCIAVCAPSVAEGFGLPLVEAAAAGRAVVASDIDAFREVGASVALFVAPGDVDAWSAALERIVADGWLRNDAAARGRRQVDGYTWERTASLTIEAYERARRTA